MATTAKQHHNIEASSAASKDRSTTWSNATASSELSGGMNCSDRSAISAIPATTKRLKKNNCRVLNVGSMYRFMLPTSFQT
jgi:hypothetical protein